MNYRLNTKNGDKVSLLAFGCMRFPKDAALTEKMIAHAVGNGVNFFDTAYIYPGSELTLGRILEKNGLREKVFISSKLPSFLVKKASDFDRYFNVQLERLRTDRIDYYFMHMLTGPDSWERLKTMGIEEWLADKKQKGQIKNVGFSYHGSADGYKKLIDARNWDFTMIIYNYYDVNSQAGRKGLMYAAEKGVPIMIMEPLRGGRLVSKLPDSAITLFREHFPGYTPAELAFRYVFAHNEVLTVLSGMSDLEVLKNNIKTACESSYELSEADIAIYEKARRLITATTKVGCTACGYCLPCKKNVDIPLCFTFYNDIALAGRMDAFFNYTVSTRGRNAALCTGCGDCESRCPQNIEIAKTLKTVRRKLEGGIFKPVGAIIRKVGKWK